MEEQRLKLLYRKHLDGDISAAEQEEFLLLLAQPGALGVLEGMEVEVEDNVTLDHDASVRVLDKVLGADVGNDKFSVRRSGTSIRFGYRYIAAAAVACLFLLGSYYFFTRHNASNHPDKSSNLVIKDADPGRNGSVLTLSNGRTFIIDSVSNRALVTGIVNSADGIKVSDGVATAFATLKTPLGRQQKLRLSDGTIVWLNAGSSIHFPTMFTGPLRVVEVTGEVYFEVVHNEHQPFIVKAPGQTIHDLGTHFDVNAYGDKGKGVKTTLIEGSVQIGGTVLKPGEQYLEGKVRQVNAQGTVAWVNGFFHFENADVKTVLSQLARWYNVEVVYEGSPPDQFFEGDLERSLTLSQVLRLLGGTGMHYTLDGKRLTIRP